MSSSPSGCDFVTSLLIAFKLHAEVINHELSFTHKMTLQTLLMIKILDTISFIVHGVQKMWTSLEKNRPVLKSAKSTNYIW